MGYKTESCHVVCSFGDWKSFSSIFLYNLRQVGCGYTTTMLFKGEINGDSPPSPNGGKKVYEFYEQMLNQEFFGVWYRWITVEALRCSREGDGFGGRRSRFETQLQSLLVMWQCTCSSSQSQLIHLGKGIIILFTVLLW